MYYIAWDKRENKPILVGEDTVELVERLKHLGWLDDDIFDERYGRWTWEEAAQYENAPLTKFIIDTWLGNTEYTDPDMKWYVVE